MQKIKEPAFVAATLKWCNLMRKQRGKKPMKKLPKGIQEDPASCPCGTATGLNVYIDRAEDPKQDYREYEIPRAVAKFVEAFDAGKLPQYDENF